MHQLSTNYFVVMWQLRVCEIYVDTW